MRFAFRALLLGFACVPFVAQANMYEIRAAYPSDKEVVNLEASGGVDVPIAIRVKVMGSAGLNTPACDAVLDFGDGSAPMALRLGDNARMVMTVTHRYTKAGEFTFAAQGAGTRETCDGRAKGTISVLAAGEKYVPKPVAPVNAQAAAAALPQLTVEMKDQGNSAGGSCPVGWFVVAGSGGGGRFTCHIAPVKPFTCPPNTTFFDAGHIVGCR